MTRHEDSTGREQDQQSSTPAGADHAKQVR